MMDDSFIGVHRNLMNDEKILLFRIFIDAHFSIFLLHTKQ